MQTCRCADRDHVNVRVSENVLIVSACLGIAEDMPCVFGPVRGGVRGVHEARPQTQLGIDGGKRLVRPRMQLAHPPDADQTDADVPANVGRNVGPNVGHRAAVGTGHD
jgi:hypothetical protein